MDLIPSMAYHQSPANGSRYPRSILTQGQVMYLGINASYAAVFTVCGVFIKSYGHDLEQHSREAVLKLCG